MLRRSRVYALPAAQDIGSDYLSLICPSARAHPTGENLTAYEYLRIPPTADFVGQYRLVTHFCIRVPGPKAVATPQGEQLNLLQKVSWHRISPAASNLRYRRQRTAAELRQIDGLSPCVRGRLEKCIGEEMRHEEED